MVIGFWRASDQYGVFCNWKHAEFEFEGKHFTCTEQAFMYKKAELFGDTLRIEKLLSLKSPMHMKSVGRAVQGFNSEVFDEHKYDFMVEVNYAKYSQNPEMKQILLSTGDAILCEASPKDSIWGIGIGLDNPDYADPAKWKGTNLLGKALMEVRDRLARESKSGKVK